MSCSVFVHIKYFKELEEKIKKIEGIIPNRGYGDFESVQVPNDLFSQHKKEVDAHKWVVKDGMTGHYSTHSGEWKYLSHGFEIWLRYKGEDEGKEIVLVAPCHWDPDHGKLTLVDLLEWIKANLGEVEIKEQTVSY